MRMPWVSDLKQLLGEGLYLHNIRRIIECCDRGLKEEQHALAAYVVRSVVADLQRDWEGQAVTVEEARRVEARLLPALSAVVAGIERGDALPILCEPLASLARTATRL